MRVLNRSVQPPIHHYSAFANLNSDCLKLITFKKTRDTMLKLIEYDDNGKFTGFDLEREISKMEKVLPHNGYAHRFVPKADLTCPGDETECRICNQH